MESMRTQGSAPSPSFTTVMHYAIAALLILGGLAYWYLKPPSLNPMADPRAAEAIALVQTHEAQRAPTLLQALNDRVKRIKERGRGVRLGEWRVEPLDSDLYAVKIWIREEGTKEWFEREYVWRVDLSKRSVAALTDAAADLMVSDIRPPNVFVPPAPSR